MNKKLLSVILLIILCLVPQSFSREKNTLSNPIFVQRTQPYYWNTADSVDINFLLIGHMYGLNIGTNQPTSEQQWINWTATFNNAHISFRQNSAPYDNTSTKLTELYVTLYEIQNNTDTGPVYLDQLVMPVIYASQQANTEALISNGVQFFIIMSIVFMGIFGAIVIWRRIQS